MKKTSVTTAKRSPSKASQLTRPTPPDIDTAFEALCARMLPAATNEAFEQVHRGFAACDAFFDLLETAKPSIRNNPLTGNFASLHRIIFENMERAIRLLRVESDHLLSGSAAQKTKVFDVPLNGATLRRLDEVARQLGKTREEVIQTAVMDVLPTWEEDLAANAARR